MTFLKFMEGIGNSEICQWTDTKLFNVTYTDMKGKVNDLGGFKNLNLARNEAFRYKSGEDSAIIKEQPRV